MGEQLVKDSKAYTNSGISDWVKKSREQQELAMKEAARKKKEIESRLLEEQMIEDEIATNKNNKHNIGIDSLAGKKVRHDLNQFKVGDTKVLILKDKSILKG